MRSLLLVSLLLAMTPGWAAPKDSANRYGKAGLPWPCQVGGMGKECPAPCDSPSLAVLLYLFALHDYDRSGQLDGLEGRLPPWAALCSHDAVVAMDPTLPAGHLAAKGQRLLQPLPCHGRTSCPSAQACPGPLQ
uniref:Uncharacterized protein n=1 Tax=Gopherus agassizii TaxID=38772 RepID=A0A452H7U0_9SAUR